MDITKYFRENIKSLSPYSTARDEYQGELGIYLDANENPYDNGLNRYPDPYQKLLKKRISELKKINAAKIFIGNGSDEPIDLVFRIFCEPRKHNVISITPTYGMYKVAAQINDVEIKEVDLDSNFMIDADRFLAAKDQNSRVAFLCSPNNPSGNLLDPREVEKIIRNFDGIVVVDEAYIDFANSQGFLGKMDEFPNLIILQTLSKAWGLAGLRLGLAFASEEIIKTMTKVKYPYNINVLTQKTVLEELQKVDERKKQIAEILTERKNLSEKLSTLDIVKRIYPSNSNFLLIKFEEPRKIYNILINGGIIVRDRSQIIGCNGCLRITIGTPAENAKLLELLKNIQ